MTDTKVLIIGGGAAGLCAAVMLGRRFPQGAVTVCEKGSRVGRKLLATGNGTCNITNLKADARRYHGGQPGFVSAALSAFTPQDAMAFFASIGVPCFSKEDGRVYPLCKQAGAVLDMLRLEAANCGVRIRTDCAVTALVPHGDAWLAETADGPVRADHVVVAVGGAASPSLGGSADGYGLLTALGCEKTPLFPSIVQIKTDVEAIRAVKGVRVDAALTLTADGTPCGTVTDELLFADGALSGPCAMKLGRVAADWERRRRGDLTAHLNFLPSFSDPEAKALLRSRRDLSPRPLSELLTGLLQKRVGQTLVKAAGLSLSRMSDTLTDAEWERLLQTVRDWRLPVRGSGGFGGAQVTAGGIATADFDERTMQSKKHRGLYAVGEVLDVDGDCGGYNLQWAWASAYAAAEDMMKREKRSRSK